jgi:thioredoxin 1
MPVEHKKRRSVQIIVPVLIVAVICGMWLVKQQKEHATLQDKTLPQTELEESVGLADADFGLRETQAIDFDQFASYGLPLIVDYGADTCIPCKEMAPVLEKANEEFQGKAFIKFINVWDYPDAANNVPVQVIPTQVLVNADGTPFVPSEELATQIEFLMYSHRETGEHVFTVHQGGLTEEQMRGILKEMGVE